MFRRRIEEGANCSPFVSRAILGIVKEVFGLNPDDADHPASGLARSSSSVVAIAAEPAGKPLQQCQKVTVRLTLDDAAEDFQVRIEHSIDGLTSPHPAA